MKKILGIILGLILLQNISFAGASFIYINIYDNSNVWSKCSFIFDYTSYRSSMRVFSNAVVKAFIEGNKSKERIKNGSSI